MYNYTFGDIQKFCNSHFRFEKVIIYGGFWAVMSAAAKSVYPVLEMHANEKSKQTFVGLDRIARLSGQSRPSVIKGVKELKRLGLVEIRKLRRGPRRAFRRNVYRLSLPDLLLNPDYLNSTPMREIRAAMTASIEKDAAFLDGDRTEGRYNALLEEHAIEPAAL